MEADDNDECGRNFTALSMHAALSPYVPEVPPRPRGGTYLRRQSFFAGWFTFDPFGYDFQHCFALGPKGYRSQGTIKMPEPAAVRAEEGVGELGPLDALEALPDEVLIAILDCLPTLFELMRCTRVCRRWKRLVLGNCLPSREVFSRRTLLPALAEGQRDPWKHAAECIHPLLFYAQPFVPKRMLKTLLKKVAPSLTHLSFDMLRNECSECQWCRESTQHCTAYLPPSANDPRRRSEWVEATELEAERHCKMEGSMKGVLLDGEIVGILAASATRLKHLNLFGVRFTTPACELSLCQGLGDRVETLVLGESGSWSPHTRVELSDFLAAFTRLKRLTILLHSCISHRKSIFEALPLPPRLPHTLVELRLLACWVDIGNELADFLADECPALRTLAICVATTVDYRCLNSICAKLENLELHFYKFSVVQADHAAGFQGELRFTPSSSNNHEAEFNAPSLMSLKVLSECAVPSAHVQQLSHFLQVIFNGLVLSSKRLVDLQINLMPLELQLDLGSTPQRDMAPLRWPIGEQLGRLTSLRRAGLWGASVNGEALDRLASGGKLRELSLRGCGGDNLLRGISAVTTKCQSLRRLTIAQCSGIESSALYATVCKCLDTTRGSGGQRPSTKIGADTADKIARPLRFADGEGKEANMHPWVVRVAPRWHAEVTGQSLLEPDSERMRHEMWWSTTTE